VGKLQHLNITLADAICESCNTGWMRRLEAVVAPVLKPMAVNAQRTVLAPDVQVKIATWAVKTALLLELAFRQMYPGSRPVEGYVPSDPELAWLYAEGVPPPRSRVWLGCWNCQQTAPLRYAPSGAPLPTSDGVRVTGQLTSFTLGFVAFQVFSVDFVAADEHGARLWNDHVPPSLAEALVHIWPPLGKPASWPSPAFESQDWERLVTWDGELRRSGDGGSVVGARQPGRP
jgi:hypothetical protein